MKVRNTKEVSILAKKNCQSSIFQPILLSRNKYKPLMKDKPQLREINTSLTLIDSNELT